MNWHTQEDLPERGKPKPKVNFTRHHELVLRAADALQRSGHFVTDQAIFDLIVRQRGKVISESGVRTRRNELVEDFRLMAKSNLKGKTESGRTCSTWCVTGEGKTKAESLRAASQQMELDGGRAA